MPKQYNSSRPSKPFKQSGNFGGSRGPKDRNSQSSFSKSFKPGNRSERSQSSSKSFGSDSGYSDRPAKRFSDRSSGAGSDSSHSFGSRGSRDSFKKPFRDSSGGSYQDSNSSRSYSRSDKPFDHDSRPEKQANSARPQRAFIDRDSREVLRGERMNKRNEGSSFERSEKPKSTRFAKPQRFGTFQRAGKPERADRQDTRGDNDYQNRSEDRSERGRFQDDRGSNKSSNRQRDSREAREDREARGFGDSKNFRGSGGSRGGRGGYDRSRGSNDSRSSRGSRNSRDSGGSGRSGRFQKTMAVDYDLLVKKAVPQAIADYIPSKTFSEHGLHHDIIRSLDLKGYTQPTAIQDQAIPHILDKKDLIGIANTGTGKTAAFLLPLIHQVFDEPDKKILILAPTRELVTQIAAELHSFTKGTKIGSTIIIGGVHQDKQVTELKKGKNFIISTTGRGLDLIKQKKLPIREVETIVLDEMDQMLDMGFINDIQKILALAVNKKHLLFFSATINKDVDKVAREILNDPILVSVIRGQTADNVNQDVVEIGAGDNKFDKLCEILGRPEVEKAIVFENTKHGSARIEKDLIARGFKALAIHGNKNQNQRQRALDAFKSGRIDILIATNVAARGLDIPLVSHVINYSLPQSKDDYIHRIGRTGRAGEIGQAYTFVPV